jgi:hypothetical protein
MKEQKYEYVRSLKLAGYLMMNGFRLLRVEPNYKTRNKKDVYVFLQSEKLSEYILKYIESTKENKENGIIINRS